MTATHPFFVGQFVLFFEPKLGGRGVEQTAAKVSHVGWRPDGSPCCNLVGANKPIGGNVEAAACLPLSALETLSGDAHGAQASEPQLTATAGAATA